MSTGACLTVLTPGSMLLSVDGTSHLDGSVEFLTADMDASDAVTASSR